MVDKHAYSYVISCVDKFVWENAVVSLQRYAGAANVPKPFGDIFRGAGTTLNLGRGQRFPGIQGNPYPKLKTPRILTLFGKGPNVRKQTQIKTIAFYIDSPYQSWVGAGAADSGGGGGQEGQSPLLEKSRRGKTIFLPLHLADLARRQLTNWSLQIENWVLFTGFLT